MNSFAVWGDSFATIIAGGTQLLTPYAMAIAYNCFALSGMWLATTIGLSSAGPSMGAARLLLVAGVWITALESSQFVSEGLLSGAVQFGMLAGGHTLNQNTFLNSPDAIFGMGFDRTITLWDMANKTCAPWYEGGCLANVDAYLTLSGAGWAMFAAFAYLAGMIMLTCIIFKLVIIAAMVLIPMAIFEHTSWLGTSPIRLIAHSTVQILVLCIIASVASLALGKIVLDNEILPHADSVPFFIGAGVLVCLTMAAQVISWRMVSGGIATAGAVFGAGAGMGSAALRSGAGHLDAPLTATARGAISAGGAAGSSAYRAISAAASANLSNMGNLQPSRMLRKP